MTTPLFPFDQPDYDVQAIGSVLALSENLGRTICIARVLVENGRVVDLAGLEHGVGLLCAKALDLPADAGRIARDHLLTLLAETAALTVALQQHSDPDARPNFRSG